MQWNSLALDGHLENGSWLNISFSVAILISGFMASNWKLQFSTNQKLHQASETFLRILPIISVVLSGIAIITISHTKSDILIEKLVYIGGAVVIFLAILRQSSLLQDRERILKAQAQLIQSTNLLHTVIQTAPLRIFWKDRNLKYLGCNDLFAKDAGFEKAQDLIGKDDFVMGWREQAQLYRSDDIRVMQTGEKTLGYEEPQTTPDGEQIWLRTSKVPLIDSTTHETIGVLGMYDDITAYKMQQNKLEYIAHYDALTNLANRLLLTDRLQQALMHTKRHNSQVAVVYLDLDGFKQVNDKHGHDIGDKLLVQIAQDLKLVLREGDTLSRFGGDEFVAILEDISNTNEIKPILERLLSASAKIFNVEKYKLNVSASIGVAFYPQEDEISPDQLIRQADQAMYEAKQSGKNRYHVFNSKQDRAIRTHHQSLERIQQALENEEFMLYYQPKVNMRSGEVIGAEALIRWNHPEMGILPPAAFLPEIQNHLLMQQVGDWVLQKAIEQIAIWNKNSITLQVSVNIDSMQLQQTNFVSNVKNLLHTYPNIQKGQLEFEILETSALEDVTYIADIINACADLGVHFALDDFGTGYSSLTYLKRLPAQTLKIDQSFVFDILEDPEDLAIIEGIQSLAQAFNRNLIAEGVETIQHGLLLLHMGCENAQGYAIAKPMEATALVKWLHEWKAPSQWLEQKSL